MEMNYVQIHIHSRYHLYQPCIRKAMVKRKRKAFTGTNMFSVWNKEPIDYFNTLKPTGPYMSCGCRPVRHQADSPTHADFLSFRVTEIYLEAHD